MSDDTKPPINLDDIDFGPTIRGHQKGDRVFDRFVLQKLLGRGGMGVVWLALDERLGREVALKFAPEAIRYDDVAVEELKEETRKGLALAHPNIVRIYDFLLDEDHAAISMEFIDGENLGALRVRQPNKVFEPEQIRPWVGQLLDALDYAHRGAKVIHRDLKPANLMIDREGNLRVTDFGIARSISDAMDRATLGRASTGTLAYMSPQQAGGKTPHVSDDIYAFGSTLYELVTGKPPFYTGNLAEQLRSEPATPPSDRRREFNISGAESIPPDWEHVILSCLEKEIENRPPNAHAIMERLGLASAARQQGEAPAMAPGQPGTAPFTPGPLTGAGHTTAYIRPGAGLTELATPTRPLTMSKVRVGGTPASPSEAPREIPAPQPAPPKKKSGSFPWLTVLAFVWLAVAIAAGGWYGYNYFKGDKKDSPPQPKPKTLVDQPKPEPKPEPEPPKPPEPAKDPKVATNPTPTPTPTPTPPMPVTPTPAPADNTIAGRIARAKAGDTITLESGTYEEPLVFKDGIHIKAAEPGKVIFQVNGKSGSALRVEKCASGSISGIVFQHLGTETAEGDAAPVGVVNSSSVGFADCVFQRGAGSGLETGGAGKPLFTRCTFANNSRNGLTLSAGTNAQLDQCTARKNGASGIEIIHSGTNPTLTACEASENADSGVVIKDGASATLGGNNRCSLNGEAGIAAAGDGTQVSVTGASCDGNKHGISIQKGASARIAGCTVRNSHEMGIHFALAAKGSEIRDCVIEKSDVYGMLLTGGGGAVALITGNKVLNNALTGILVTGDGFRPTLEKNESSRNGEYGIGIAEGASGIVRDNTLSGNNRGGVGQQNAAKDLVIENNIVTGDEGAK